MKAKFAAIAALGAVAVVAAFAAPSQASTAPAKHVLLISVDGMHQSDLEWYVKTNPNSTLAHLVKTGSEYTNAQTPFPSDSFPGLVGQVTGGNPKTTGIYYDVTWNQSLLDPSASKSVTPTAAECSAATPGAVVAFDESLDMDMSRLDAGQGLSLPSDILNLTSNAASLINPLNLPIDPKTCTRVYPHNYLKVNTVFEVAHKAGLVTAWADKHPAYDIVSGPSGTGVTDFFTPEINSDAGASGGDYTSNNSLTQQYDDIKVQALLNEIAGYNHAGTKKQAVPAIFGMNFQAVSTAEKLPTSLGFNGGYDATGTVPGPVLSSALSFIDREVGSIELALERAHLTNSTTVIISAKHAQSPKDTSSLKRIDDGTITDALNAAFAAAQPTAAQPLIVNSMDDDGFMLWFNKADQTAANYDFATKFLSLYSGNGTGTDGKAKATDYTKNAVAYTSAGISTFYAGAAAANYFGLSQVDDRVPDFIGVVQHGVVYTGKTKKIAEHGGADPQDRDVPLLLNGAGVHAKVNKGSVETTQIAPTILKLLGLDPNALEAVKAEKTKALN